MNLLNHYNIISKNLKTINMSSPDFMQQSKENLTESLLSAEYKQSSSRSADFSDIGIKNEKIENQRPQDINYYQAKPVKTENTPAPARKERSLKLFQILNHDRSGDQDNFSLDQTAPKSRQIRFQLQNANPKLARQVSQVNILDFLNHNLRKSIVSQQRKDLIKKMTNCSHQSRSCSQILTILNKQQAISVLSLYQQVLRIGQQIKLQQLLALLQKLICQYNSQSPRTKKQILLKVLTLSNHTKSLFVIRMYQVLVAFVHIFPIERGVAIFLLKVLEAKLRSGKTRLYEQEYLRFLIFYLFRKLQSTEQVSPIVCIPIRYQLSCLIFLRQIQVPCYLPSGNYVLVHAEPYETFSEIKTRAMVCFGIDPHSQRKELFQFILFLQRDSKIVQLPIDQNKNCWDYLSGIHYQKYQLSELEIDIKISILLKLNFPLKTTSEDANRIEILFANYFLQFSIGNIEINECHITQAIYLINSIKYQHSLQLIFPFKFKEHCNRSQFSRQINNCRQYYKNFDSLSLKYKFIEICSKAKEFLGVTVSTKQQFSIKLRKNQMMYVGKGGIILKEIELNSIKSWQVDGEFLALQFFDPYTRGQIIISENSNIIASYLNNELILLKEGFI